MIKEEAMTDDPLLVTVRGMPTGPAINLDLKRCAICVRAVSRQRGLRPMPGHSGH